EYLQDRPEKERAEEEQGRDKDEPGEAARHASREQARRSGPARRKDDRDGLPPGAGRLPGRPGVFTSRAVAGGDRAAGGRLRASLAVGSVLGWWHAQAVCRSPPASPHAPAG